jgi:hypothetical protein
LISLDIGPEHFPFVDELTLDQNVDSLEELNNVKQTAAELHETLKRVDACLSLRRWWTFSASAGKLFLTNKSKKITIFPPQILL